MGKRCHKEKKKNWKNIKLKQWMRLQSLRVASTWQKKYDENAHEGVATELIAQVPHVNHVRRHYPNKPTNKKKWFTNVHLPF